jgi:hypothetical protein
MASLDDILTTQKNGVVAINGITKSNFPLLTSSVIQASTTTLITTGSGRIYSVSVPEFSGSGHVYVYDSATAAGVGATNLIYKSLAVNASSFIPYVDIRLTYSNGLVLKTDANINFCVGYTPN